MKNDPHDHDQHGQHDRAGHAHVAADTTQDVGTSIAQKPYTDLVCGMQVAANPQKEIEQDGQSYYFCNSGCMEKIRASPQTYLRKNSSAPALDAVDGTLYTCPIHPEIRQPAPGSCPM